MGRFVSRAGDKLDAALQAFELNVAGLVCADLGCNAGGFVDCLLARGARRVYAIDTGYGMLEWKLRKDPRVVVMERTNAMHATLPEPMQLVTVDVAWTRQKHILPAAGRMISLDGSIVTLIKPHYEADATLLIGGVLPADRVNQVVGAVQQGIFANGFEVIAIAPSPILGARGNKEVLAWLKAQRRLPEQPVEAAQGR